MITMDTKNTESLSRIRLNIYGTVQGVGFRPFIYRLAKELNLYGWINNSPQGVVMEVEGSNNRLTEFIERIETDKPPLANIQNIDISYHQFKNYDRFTIGESSNAGSKNTVVLPDIATCPDCLAEMFDPTNRRYRYPFTNCTNCGPRYSIVESLPYDRDNTTMKIFRMCDECRAEYENPIDRRFHAQPIACPNCGPHLELWDKRGKILETKDASLLLCFYTLLAGKIIAVKGLGGFQLLVDARNDDAVRELRQRKKREKKPFALMFPDINMIKRHCLVSPLEKKLLLSSRAPIVLIDKIKTDDYISDEVAPGNPSLGVMLPYTPLHHLIMSELSIPLVATSGNFSDEPICIDEYEALSRLNNIADLYLVHNRPIARQVDDSVVRVMMNRESIIRSARGYAPTVTQLHSKIPPSLAVGGFLKNSIAISINNSAVVSQHIGDLDTGLAYETFSKTIDSLSNIYDFKPDRIIADKHPDYPSTHYAEKSQSQVHYVQHHHAHVLSCMADNNLDYPVMGVSWDGTGYGYDGTIWGGEFLKVFRKTFVRVAHLRHFKLPGGDMAVKEPRRSAAGLLFELFGDKFIDMTDVAPINSFSTEEKNIIGRMLKNNINSPVTSSMGRLFDAVASILNLCHKSSFEGEAAMLLEFDIENSNTDETYEFEVTFDNMPYIIDWESVVQNILSDINNSVPVSTIAVKFHKALVNLIVHIAEPVDDKNIVLSGGCFQNKYLLENIVPALRESGFSPYWHKNIPTNDGGIALGQIVAGINKIREEQ